MFHCLETWTIRECEAGVARGCGSRVWLGRCMVKYAAVIIICLATTTGPDEQDLCLVKSPRAFKNNMNFILPLSNAKVYKERAKNRFCLVACLCVARHLIGRLN